MEQVYSIHFFSYLKQLFNQLFKFEVPNLNAKPLSNPELELTLTPKEESEVTKELHRMVNENLPDPHPTPENKTAKWITNKVAASINPQIFKGFMHGLLPGFRFRNFIEPNDAAKIGTAIRGFVEEYKTAPGVGKAGETLVEHSHDFDEYAEYAAILKDPNISIPHRLELVDKVVGFLIRNTGFQFKPLQKDGVECFYGLFRQINTGAGWHLDDVTRDSDVFSTRKAIFQGSGVLHIITPAKGGETIMANRKAQDGDSQYLNGDGWTYNPEMLDGIVKAEVPCITGDLVFLSTHNYHMVKPCLETGAERISFSMFFVVFEDEPNIFYYYN
ncbi:MAG: hypothetical protein U0T75_02010 [Chitinophagales bacterium]